MLTDSQCDDFELALGAMLRAQDVSYRQLEVDQVPEKVAMLNLRGLTPATSLTSRLWSDNDHLEVQVMYLDR